MRTSILALVALAFLRTVIGLHFFLEGVSHLRDPDWSSVGFRQAAVGPLAPAYRELLPETGDWSGTLAAADGRSLEEATKAWTSSLVAAWRRDLADRQRAVPLAGDALAAAEKAIAAAEKELASYVAGIREELSAYRLEVGRLAAQASRPEAAAIPFERDRVARKRRELSGQAAAWMAAAEAIGRRLHDTWDAALEPADRSRAAAATPPSPLWRADRFVSWSLVTIGACLVLGLFTKFNAMGGACFLLTVIASQPFWVPGAQATYAQWVELAALVALATLPTGGWSGLDYFLPFKCPLARCSRATPGAAS